MIIRLEKGGLVTVSPKWLAGYYRDGALEYKRDPHNTKIWRLAELGMIV